MSTELTVLARRSVRLDMFADLTPARMRVRRRDDGRWLLTFDATLDAATTAAVRARIESRNDVEATLRSRTAAAMQANRDDIAANDIAANSEIASQVKTLTAQSSRQARQLVALERLVLGLLDGTD